MGTSNVDVDLETSGRERAKLASWQPRSPSGSPINHQTMSDKKKKKKKERLLVIPDFSPNITTQTQNTKHKTKHKNTKRTSVKQKKRKKQKRESKA